MNQAFRRATTGCVLAAFVATLPGAPAFAELAGEQVKHGQATFERSGKHTQITTKTRSTIVDYDRFDIQHDESVHIDQPTARSRILNRIGSADSTRIDGKLSSDGIVYILNPSGVFFGGRAVVDVSGMVAGAGHLSNADFLKGIDRITGVEGEVAVAAGAMIRSAGHVALIGQHVSNYGSVLSRGGQIALVAGENVVLAPLDGNVIVRVDPGATEPPPGADPARFGVEQGGELTAQRVVLSAGDGYSLAMNHTGVTRAEEIHVRAGEDGLAQIAGTLDASNAAAGERGGRIEVRAGKIAVLAALLDASGAAGGGEILLGGDVRGSGDGVRARRLFVAPDAYLRADALVNGDGGRVVAYADERNGFYGHISARGGALGGDGGFAEISAARLEARGDVDLGAPQGKSGTLLYDPEVIEIIGGTLDGDDADSPGTPTSVVDDDGTAGRILTGSDGDGSAFGETFRIYESEIEGTDANIILEASNRIFVSGLFDNSVEGEANGSVLLKRGRSLTLRTTGDAPPTDPTDELGIDLTSSADHGTDLTWTVRDGGDITIQTDLDVLSPDNAAAPRASIQIGKLVSDGAEYESEPQENISVLQPVPDNPRTILITAQRGDIEVADIQINGDDARGPTGPGTFGRTTSRAGNVTISADQGNVAVGGISAVGGSGTQGETNGQGSPGLDGGFVNISASGGNVTIDGPIDVSGGRGRGLFTVDADGDGETDDPAPLLRAGGFGGGITVSARGTDADKGDLTVNGNLIARGGDGLGTEGGAADGGMVQDGIGSAGGTITLGADSDLRIGTTGTVQIDASGGNGTGAGGAASGGVSGAPAAIQITRGSANAPAGDFDLEIDANVVANGGAGGFDFADMTVSDPRIGGVGGRGGDITVSSNGGTLSAGGMTIEANGGDGFLELDTVTGLPRTDETGAAATLGGRGGVVNVNATSDVAVGTVESKGGGATHGSGDAGGPIAIFSDEGDLVVGSVDSSGGSASSPETGVVLRGGVAGSVTLGPDSGGVGDVTIEGVVGGAGGTGQDAAGVQTFAQGASVEVNADQVDGAIDATPGARFRGRNVTLIGFRIGADGAPVRVSGTGGADDSANFVTFDELHGDVVDTGGQVELASVVMKRSEADAELFANGSEIAQGSGTAATHTISEIDTTAEPDLALIYRLDVTPTTTGGVTSPIPDLEIARGAVNLGDAGGIIANGGATDSGAVSGNRGAIVGEVAGTDPHVTSSGAVRFEGRSVGKNAANEERSITLASTDADRSSVQFDVLGDVDAEVASGNFGAVSIIQRDALAGDVNIDLNAPAGDGDEIVAVSEGTTTAQVHRIADADMTNTGSNFAYRLVSGAADATLEVDRVVLDGTGLLESGGDVVLTDAAPVAITANHNRLTLQSLAGSIRQESSGAGATTEIEMGGTGSGPAALVFGGDAFGSQAAPIQTKNLAAVAGVTTDGGIFLNNTEGDTLAIQRVSNPIPEDVAVEPTLTVTATGLDAADGDIQVTHAGDRIVLGRLVEGTDAQGAAFHVRSTGDITLDAVPADGRIEVENARYEKTLVPVTGTVFRPKNDALVIAGGDVTFSGDVITSANSTVAKPESAPPISEFIHATLTVAANGVTTFEGDIGGDVAAPSQRLARLDTTDAKFTDADGARVEVGEAQFRGTIDGPASLTVRAAALPPFQGETQARTALVQFDGNIGQQEALGGLDVQAEQIVFTGADRVTTSGDVVLDTQQTGVPTVATISDTGGGLRIQTADDFRVGDRDKLSSAGPLAIDAGGTARFTDLSATEIRVNANEIQIFKREPGQLTQPDGSVSASFDSGTDIVANTIQLGVVPTAEDGPGADPVFGLGSGGLKAPGSMQHFRVIRFTSGSDRVARENLIGVDGAILDLTASGPNVIGDPSEDLPRERPTPQPSLQAQPSDDGPSSAPPVTAEQLIAYLRCGEPSAPSPSCDASELAPLSSVTNWPESALATQRAGDLRAAYGELRQTNLSEAFAKAGNGFRAQQGFGEFDAAGFGRYLETSPDAEEARAAIHRFAELLVEVDLLGLSPDGVLRVRQQLAGELAAEADLPGFDADAVLTAVAATPIGMPPSSL